MGEEGRNDFKIVTEGRYLIRRSPPQFRLVLHPDKKFLHPVFNNLKYYIKPTHELIFTCFTYWRFVTIIVLLHYKNCNVNFVIYLLQIL